MGDITVIEVKENLAVKELINAANHSLEQIGYTEHGLRHVGFVSHVAAQILQKLEYPPRTIELAAIAGYVHDVGNAVSRKYHGLTGATLLQPILLEMGMPMCEIVQILAAVGNHEEDYGTTVSEISAALIIADKIDAHRTRVRRGSFNPMDIHDRVNYSIKKNWLEVDKEKHTIRYGLTMDETSSVMEFMQIYISRMVMCEQSAKYLGCSFILEANGMTINNYNGETLTAHDNGFEVL